MESKLNQVLMKGDKAMYHRVAAYEAAKTEDQLKQEFGIPAHLQLKIESLFDARN